MQKREIVQSIIDQLQADLWVLEDAVNLARDTATHADCLGSSKYETMGLEASYLAQGQGLRLLEVERALQYFNDLALSPVNGMVGLSSLFVLQDDQGNSQCLWLATEAGGLKVQCGDALITVITPKAPLGRAVMGKAIHDSVEVNIAGAIRCYEVVDCQ